jgi:cytidyltransferase-like protein
MSSIASSTPSSTAAGKATGESPRTYSRALLEIPFPLSINQTLRNDQVLTKVKPLVNDCLFVYICSTKKNTTSRAAVCEYISSVYSRLWDEMLQFDPMNFTCVVVGDIPDGGLATRTELWALKEIDAVFSFDGESTTGLKKSRASSGLPAVDVVSTEELLGANATKRHVETPIYYFDDVTGELPRFKVAALGGTFDQLHNGHRKLLTLAAASCTESLVIGVTGEAILQNKTNAADIARYSTRVAGVESFLSLVKPSLKLNIVELQDPFGPTITDPKIEAIVVSSETIAGAHKINDIRVERGFNPLSILVSRRSEAATLSSTFLRNKKKAERA